MFVIRLLVIFYLFSSTILQAAIQHQKVGVVDMKRVIEYSSAVSKLNKDIRDRRDEINKDLEQNIEVITNNYNDSIKELKDSNELENSYANMGKKISNLKKERNLKIETLEYTYSKLMKVINDKVIDIITKIAISHSYNLILPISQILYTGSKINVTESVIQILNKELPEIALDLE